MKTINFLIFLIFFNSVAFSQRPIWESIESRLDSKFETISKRFESFSEKVASLLDRGEKLDKEAQSIYFEIARQFEFIANRHLELESFFQETLENARKRVVDEVSESLSKKFDFEGFNRRLSFIVEHLQELKNSGREIVELNKNLREFSQLKDLILEDRKNFQNALVEFKSLRDELVAERGVLRSIGGFSGILNEIRSAREEAVNARQEFKPLINLVDRLNTLVWKLAIFVFSLMGLCLLVLVFVGFLYTKIQKVLPVV